MRIEYTAAFELDNSDAAFLAAAVNVVIERGTNYRYDRDKFEGCVNVCMIGDEYVPACLVGAILVRLGVPGEWFESTHTLASDAVRTMRKLGFSERVTDAAMIAQGVQDNQKTWGEALTEMVRAYAEMVDTSDPFNSTPELSDEPPF